MSAPLSIYLRDAYAYSCIGCTPTEIYTSVETHVQFEPDVQTETGSVNRYSLSSLSDSKALDRVQTLLKQFMPEAIKIFPSNINSHNARLWLHLPDQQSSASQCINAYTMTTFFQQTQSVLKDLDCRVSEEHDSLQQAIVYLHKREDLQYLLYFCVDSHLDMSTAPIMGEGASLLVLQKSATQAQLRICPITYQMKPYAEQSFSTLASEPHQTVVTIHQATNESDQFIYQLEKALLKQPFSHYPQSENCQLVKMFPHIGQTNIALSLGLMYLLGQHQLSEETCAGKYLLSDLGETYTQNFQIARCL